MPVGAMMVRMNSTPFWGGPSFRGVVAASSGSIPISGTVAVPLPAHQPGDRLWVALAGTTYTLPADWSVTVTYTDSGVGIRVATKIAASDAETLVLTNPNTSFALPYIAHARAIINAATIPGESMGSVASAAGSFDPATVTTPWGSALHKWFVALATNATGLTAPSGYGDFVVTTAGNSLATAWLDKEGDTENAGVFGRTGGGNNARIISGAVRPA
jgi:hypothetical protein